jgi:hypothetical protein
MLRSVLFGRIALGTATFHQSHSRSLIGEEHEDSCGVSRKRARSNAEWRPPGSEELPNGREREDECVDRRGTALWWSVFTFFMEGFAAYGASMHPTAAFPLRLP